MNDNMDIEQRVGRKVIRLLVVPSALFLLVGSIDRTNVGFAALQMNAALGISSAEYGFGAGILFAGYLLAKYPSVVLLEKIGMHRWLALISATWGICAIGMAFIDHKFSYYALRFAIGASEAGLAAGLFLYLSNWASDRFSATILSFPIVAIPIAQVIGAPLSGWLIESSNPFDLEGWRWMFLVEGAPAILLAIFAYFYFPDRPAGARWLSSKEIAWIGRNVAGSTKPKAHGRERWSALKNPVTWLCTLIWFCLLAGNYGVLFWLPQVVQHFSGLGETKIGFIVALPWLGNAIGLLINGRHSDITQERYLHIGIPCAIAAVNLILAYLIGGGPIALIALILGGSFLGSTVAPFWAIPTKLLTAAQLSVGVVTIHMAGTLAGLTIPALIGVLHDRSQSFGPPIYLIACILVAALALCLVARRIEERNRLSTQPAA